MKRPRKFYRDKEYRRRIIEANAFDRHVEYYKQNEYRTVYILSKEAKKHPLGKALAEILPLIVVGFSHRREDTHDEPILLNIKRSLYVKLKTEHQECFTRDREIFDPWMRHFSRVKRDSPEPVYYLLPELKELIISEVHKNYIKHSLWASNPFEPSLDRNAIRLKARKIFDEMNDDDWYGSRCRRALKTIDILSDVKKEVVDLT